MKLLKGVVLTVLLLGLLGCVPPHRVSVRSDGVMALWSAEGVIIYDPHTEKMQRVTPAGDLAKMDICWVDWSPDGTKLLIGGGRGGPKPSVVEAQIGDAQGANFKTLFTLKDEMTYYAQWRPDGKAVTFVAWPEKGTSELREVDVETGEVRGLMKGACIFHRYHPQGKSLAAVRSDMGLDDSEPFAAVLTRISADGSTKPGAAFVTHVHPWLDWSPDGKSLLFCVPKTEMPFALGTDREEIEKQLGHPGLYVITDGGDIKRLTRRSIGYAVYSPDGKHILFAEIGRGDKITVGVMKSNGTRVVRLDSGPESSFDGPYGVAACLPVWLSNSRVLYYKEPREGFDDFEEMWAIDIDGRNKEDLGAKLKTLMKALPETR